MGNRIVTSGDAEFEQAVTKGPATTNGLVLFDGKHVDARHAYNTALLRGMDDTKITYDYLDADPDMLELKSDSNAKLILGLVHYFGLHYRDVDQTRGRMLITEAANMRNSLAIAALVRIRYASCAGYKCNSHRTECRYEELPFFNQAVGKLLAKFHDHPVSAIVNALRNAEMGLKWKFNGNRREGAVPQADRWNARSYEQMHGITDPYPMFKSLHLLLSGRLFESMELGCSAALIRIGQFKSRPRLYPKKFRNAVRCVSAVKAKCSGEFDIDRNKVPEDTWMDARLVFDSVAYEGLTLSLEAYERLSRGISPDQWQALLLYNPAHRQAKQIIESVLPQPLAEEVAWYLTYNAANIHRVKRARV